MWKRCVREGFKCGSCTEGSWPTQNKAQQPSRINEKPSQLMLFASMIPSKTAFLQLNIFKEANGCCLNEFDCSFHHSQSLLKIIYLLAVIIVLFCFPRKVVELGVFSNSVRNPGAQNQTYNPCSPAEVGKARHSTGSSPAIKVIRMQLFPKRLIHRLDEHI